MLKMKRSLFFVFCILIFFSCSNSGNVTYTGSDGETLKKVILNKEDAAVWTRELESVRLTKKLNQIDSVQDSVSLTPDVLKITNIQNEKIYPFVKDFGSLDISELNEEIYKTAQDFSDALSNDLFSVQSYFSEKSLFSYIFFLEDIKTVFFDGVIPKSEQKVFDKYLIGKGYESGDEIQIPLRFYKESGNIDLSIYISKDDLKISQIKIDRYVKK